jgi:hypothetical protein
MTTNNLNNSALQLFQSLEERLLRALMHDSSKFARIAASQITVEIYLAALFQLYPNEISPHIENVEPLKLLVEHLGKIDIGIVEIGPAAQSKGAILNLRIDPQLIHCVEASRTIANSDGRSRIELADFMRAIASDSAIRGQLREKRHLIIRPHLDS